MRIDALVLSCEHADNRVPSRYAHRFASPAARAALAGHRGFDPGALPLARTLARELSAPLFHTTFTRLLVEPNRSRHHRELWSEFSAPLPERERARILRLYYEPHRARVEAALRTRMARGKRTLHVAVHSFTPRLGGQARRTDVGLLYDPARPAERRLCARWKRVLASVAPELRVRRNYPYRGADDGLTTHLRRVLPRSRYLGVELEVSQALLDGTGASVRRVHRALVESLAETLA